MAAGAVFQSADRTYASAHGAAHGNLLFDSRFNISNHLVIAAAPADVCPGLDIADAIFFHYLSLKNPGNLFVSAPFVIHHTGFSDK